MGDPLSLAAGAVGILSLAIQITDGLSKYYASYKHQSRHIKQTVSRLEQVHIALTALQSTLDQRVFHDDEVDIITATESALFDSFDLIQDLQQEYLKLVEKKSLDDIRGSIRIAGRRIGYPFRESTLQKLNEDIQAFQDNLTLATNVLLLRDTRQLRENVECTKELAEAIRGSQNSSEIREFLNPRDVMVDLIAASSKRLQATGLWFIDGSTYQNWLHRSSPCLWVSGFAGSGKSVLCSTAVQATYHYKQHKTDLDTAVCFFYFTFSDHSKQDALSMLNTIVYQLSAQSPKIQDALKAFYDLNKVGIMTMAMMLDFLRRSVLLLDSVYIFLDAIDEVPRGRHRREVLETIRSMNSWSDSSLHLLITSRDEMDIRDSISSLTVTEIPMKNVTIDQDIENYIDQVLKTDILLRRKWESYHDKIRHTLTSRAQGVFRWVECQLEAIKRCPRSPKRLEDCLRNLPPDLDLTYERMLCSIGEESFRDALRLLKVLCFSARPLTVSELIDALAVDLTEPPRLDRSLRFADADSICEICPGLIQIEQPGPADRTTAHTAIREPTVRLAHFSIQEYLTCERIQSQKAHRFSLSHEDGHTELALVCITYLCEPQLLQWPVVKLRRSFETSNDPECVPFAFYAATQWENHYNHVTDVGHAVHDTLSHLFLSKPESFVIWTQLRYSHRWHQKITHPVGDKSELPNPLWYASFLGYTLIVQKLLDHGSNVNADGGSGSTTPLAIASYYGRMTIMQHLLDNGADPKLRSSSGCTALLAACAGGHEQAINILIDAGASINEPGMLPSPIGTGATEGIGFSPLQAASLHGHKVVVEMLIAAGVDVNFRGVGGCTALYAAASEGQEAMVELLIEKGANIHAVGCENKTPLYVASKLGHTGVVQLLLKHGADVNARCGPHTISIPRTYFATRKIDGARVVQYTGSETVETGGLSNTALHATTERGEIEVAELLLEHGADVNAENKKGETAFYLAAVQSWPIEYMDLLILKGVDLGKEIYETLFMRILDSGDPAVLDMLIRNGLNLGSPDRGGFTVFHKLVLETDEVDLLWAVIESRGEFKMPAEIFPEALMLASKHDKQELVRSLIEYGLNRVTSGKELGLALQTAIDKGHVGTARILIGRGADLNLETLRYGTALQRSVIFGFQELVEILLDKGASINARSIYGDALWLASCYGHLEIARLLVIRGPNVHAQFNEYGVESVSQFYAVREPILQYHIRDIATLHNPLFDTGAADQGSGIDKYAGMLFRCLLAEILHTTVAPKISTPPQHVSSYLMRDDAKKILKAASLSRGTALQVAAAKGHLDIVRFLIQEGANVNSLPGAFGTALEGASHGGKVDIIRLLIDNGADVNATGYYGSALDSAREGKHDGAVEIPLRHGAKERAGSQT